MTTQNEDLRARLERLTEAAQAIRYKEDRALAITAHDWAQLRAALDAEPQPEPASDSVIVECPVCHYQRSDTVPCRCGHLAKPASADDEARIFAHHIPGDGGEAIETARVAIESEAEIEAEMRASADDEARARAIAAILDTTAQPAQMLAIQEHLAIVRRDTEQRVRAEERERVPHLQRDANERRDMIECSGDLSLRSMHQLAQEGCRFFYLRPRAAIRAGDETDD